MNSRKNASERRAPTCTLETPLKITGIGRVADGTSTDYIRQHAGFKLGKFAMHIQDIEIRFKDESGPHGDPLWACTIGVWLNREDQVPIERHQATAQAAIDLAVNVAECPVRRLLQRRQDLERSTGSDHSSADSIYPGGVR